MLHTFRHVFLRVTDLTVEIPQVRRQTQRGVDCSRRLGGFAKQRRWPLRWSRGRPGQLQRAMEMGGWG